MSEKAANVQRKTLNDLQRAWRKLLLWTTLKDYKKIWLRGSKVQTQDGWLKAYQYSLKTASSDIFAALIHSALNMTWIKTQSDSDKLLTDSGSRCTFAKQEFTPCTPSILKNIYALAFH